MNSHYRQSVKWNNKLLQSKALRFYFFSVFFGGIVEALVGGQPGVKIIAPAVGLLFILLGVGQGYVAFGLFTHKDFFASIFIAIIAAVLFAAGFSAIMVSFTNVPT